MKVVALWGGGKESCLACYKAISEGLAARNGYWFLDISKYKISRK